MKHYVNLDEQQVTDQVMEQLAGKLRAKPKKAEGEAKLEGNGGA